MEVGQDQVVVWKEARGEGEVMKKQKAVEVDL
jgi:hypothetical protein